jgi:hypothetical protein
MIMYLGVSELVIVIEADYDQTFARCVLAIKIKFNRPNDLILVHLAYFSLQSIVANRAAIPDVQFFSND